VQLHCSSPHENREKRRSDTHGGGATPIRLTWAIASRDGDAYKTHAHIFNPLAGTEGRRQCGTPVRTHPVTSDHRERGRTPLGRCLLMTGRVCMSAACLHTGTCATHAQKHTRARGEMLHQRFFNCDKRRRAASPSCNVQAMHMHAGGGVKAPRRDAILTLSYGSQEAFVLVIPRREELQHAFLLLLYSRLTREPRNTRLTQRCLARKRRMGWFRPSTPLSVIPLLPRVSLRLFEETQEVCRNVHFAVCTDCRSACRPRHHTAVMTDGPVTL